MNLSRVESDDHFMWVVQDQQHYDQTTLTESNSNVCPSLRVTNQVPHPYKTRNKMTVLYTSIFKTGDRKIKHIVSISEI